MNYKHLSQIERYQIHSLMKAQHNITIMTLEQLWEALEVKPSLLFKAALN